MKKAYVTPDVEKVCFQYRDQVVAASGTNTCTNTYGEANSSTCELLNSVNED